MAIKSSLQVKPKPSAWIHTNSGMYKTNLQHTQQRHIVIVEPFHSSWHFKNQWGSL